MRLKADNRVLTENQPKTVLTAAVSAAATSLTVANNGVFADDDYLLIGRIGEERAEIVRIDAAVSAGTALTTSALVFAHDIDTPVTKIDFNQVRFYHGSTSVAGDSTALAAAQNIDPTEIFSYYEDESNTTGYGFVRFYNVVGNDFSAFSSPIDYSLKFGYSEKALRMIRKKVRRLIKQPDPQNSDYDDDEIDEEINLAQSEVAHDRLWSFYEKTRSFSSVANKYEYDLPTQVFVLFDIMFDTQPLVISDRHRINQLRWDNDTTGDPTHIAMWGRKAIVYPYKSSAADADQLNGALTATATTITVDDTSDFQAQGRILIDSEVISYTGKTATTFTGCTRGEEGTTATTHSDDAAVTERDFIYHFQEDPDPLQDEGDETAITEPSVIAYKAAAELTEGALHDRLLAKFDKAMVQLRRVDEPKIKRAFGQVRDTSETIQDFGGNVDPNQYPQNVTGA